LYTDALDAPSEVTRAGIEGWQGYLDAWRTELATCTSADGLLGFMRRAEQYHDLMASRGLDQEATAFAREAVRAATKVASSAGFASPKGEVMSDAHRAVVMCGGANPELGAAVAKQLGARVGEHAFSGIVPALNSGTSLAG